LDLLEEASRDALKAKLKSYLGARIELYREPVGFDFEEDRRPRSPP
jgi:hypothetical protein